MKFVTDIWRSTGRCDPMVSGSTPTRLRRCGLIGAGTISALCLAAQWNIDGNRRIDFRIYHRAISSMGEGGLYGYGEGILRFTYPPVTAAVFWPFTLLDESVAAHWWLVVSVTAFVAAYALAFRHAGGPIAPAPGGVLAGAATALWTVPAAASLRFGQISPLLTLLICVDMAVIGRRSRWGGVLSGVAAALRVTPLAAVPILLASRRRDGWRCVATFVAISTTAAIVSPATTRQFARRLFDGAAARGGHSVDLRTILRAVVPGNGLADVVWLVASAALVIAGARRARRLPDAGGRPDGVGLLTIGACLSYVISPLSWVHHLTLAVVALVLWATRASARWHCAMVLVGLFGLLDPSAGESLFAQVTLVAFGIATVVALPDAIKPDAVGPDAVAHDAAGEKGDRADLAASTGRASA